MTLPSQLLIDPDYGADDLLWDTKGGGVDVNDLPISPETREWLRRWQRQWDTFSMRDMRAQSIEHGMAAGSERPTAAEDWDAHEREGKLIWIALQNELGPQWKVGKPEYVDGIRRVRWSP